MLENIIQKIRKDTLVKQNTILFAGTMTLNVLNYFYHFSVGRILGPADYGILGAFFSIMYILFAPVNSIQTILAKFTADFLAKNEPGKVSYLLKRSLAVLSYISIGIFLIFLIFSKQIANFGLAIILIYLGFNLYGAITAITIALLFSFLFAFYYLKKAIPNDFIKIDSKSIYNYSLPVLITMTVITAMYTTDVILVKHFFEPITAGLYAAASLLGKIIFFASYSFSWVMFPKIAEAHSKGEPYKHIFHKSLLFVALLSAIAVIIYWLMPHFIVNLLFGEQYIGITNLIAPFGLAMGLFSVAFVVANYYLSINRIKFIYVLTAFLLIEILSIWFFHETLEQVVNILLITMITLVTVLFLVRK